ncbi:hypothetical protein [Streptomyces sp. JNUCC 63]
MRQHLDRLVVDAREQGLGEDPAGRAIASATILSSSAVTAGAGVLFAMRRRRDTQA